jgi:hypothetical protein
MSKVVLFAASLLLVAGIASAGIIDPCTTGNVVYNGTEPICYFACPQGDTDSFNLQGLGWSFTILDLVGAPVADIPGTDFWLVDCDAALDLALCAGSASSAADSATNDLGKTTMGNGSLSAGGCANGLSPVVQGFVLEDPLAGCAAYCYNILVRSPDINGDGEVQLIDLSIFASHFPPKPYDTCSDMDCNATINIQDLARFAFHFGPPGHKCS